MQGEEVRNDVESACVVTSPAASQPQGVPEAVPTSQRFLSFVLELACPAWFYDVTLDPEKTDIMFRDEGVVLGLMQRCVKDYFEGRSMAPEVLNRKPGEMSSAARAGAV